jgi:Ca-activated chloride channel homolog
MGSVARFTNGRTIFWRAPWARPSQSPVRESIKRGESLELLRQTAGLALFLAAAGASTQGAWAQSGSPSAPGASSRVEEEFKLSTQAELVMLDVGVKDQNGAIVSNLTKDNFRVFENGKLQVISSFAHEDVPVTVGLVIDSSGSMQTKIPLVTAAGLAFIQESNRNDEIFVTQFNDSVRVSLPKDVPFTSDIPMLRTALTKDWVHGRTALYDAIVFSLEHLASGKQDKKTLLLVSDGGDNASTHQFKDVMAAVRESRATIYTIGIFDENDPDRNPGLLQRLAKVTGGEAFFPSQTSEVVGICQHIAKDIRSRYTIEYVPIRSDDKASLRTTKVDVTGAGRKLIVHARTSYLLPER